MRMKLEVPNGQLSESERAGAILIDLLSLKFSKTTNDRL